MDHATLAARVLPVTVGGALYDLKYTSLEA
jgi:hypothetical protein